MVSSHRKKKSEKSCCKEKNKKEKETWVRLRLKVEGKADWVTFLVFLNVVSKP